MYLLKNRFILLCLFVSLSVCNTLAQKLVNEFTYLTPVDLPVSISAGFAELRPNHFHGGIDYRTQGTEGKNIYAVADGYVCKIQVSGYGYGNLLFISHRNGIISTYGHLKAFAPPIAEYVRAKQYEQHTFDIVLIPEQEQFKVKKGQVIAFSGNTGASHGVHLHFELHDSITNDYINPFLYNHDVADNIPPKIFGLFVYSGKNRSKVAITGKNGKYVLTGKKAIDVSGKTGFGLIANDMTTNSKSLIGIYDVQLFVDNELIYESRFDRLGVDQNRNINSHIDFLFGLKWNKGIQKTCVAPNNKLLAYRNIINNGFYDFNDNEIHQVKYLVSDVAGNVTTLEFNAKSKQPESKKLYRNYVVENKNNFAYNRENYFIRPDIRIIFPVDCFFDSIDFRYSKADFTVKQKTFSDIHCVHTEAVPIAKRYTLSIDGSNVPEHLRSKALIAKVTGKTGLISEGGVWINNFITANPNTFGCFVITVDTIPPTIKPVSLSAGKKSKGSAYLAFKIYDYLSGIKSFDGYVDGKWILFEYDPKNNLIYHRVNALDSISSGKHHLVLKVADWKDNVSEFECDFQN